MILKIKANERASNDGTNEIDLNIINIEEDLHEKTGEKIPLDSYLDNSLLYI